MLEKHPTWDILDSSKLATFLECPRKYFFEYVLAWRTDAPNNHLIFGQAWHDAMEHLLLYGYSDNSIFDAYDKFLATYRKEFPEDSDELYAPKTPMNALKALGKYTEHYTRDLDEFEVLYTEIAGTVPITEDQVLHFRLDSICRDIARGYYFSLEHKTGSRLSRFWTDQWPLAVAIGTYTHVLYCLYPGEEIYGVKINGTFFQKTKIGLQRVPIRKTLEQMQQWMWNVVWWADQIAWQFETLMACSENDEVLMAFPQNPTSCTKYFGCPYHDFCLAWPNPLQHCDEPPTGMKIEYWDPTEREATHRMEL